MAATSSPSRSTFAPPSPANLPPLPPSSVMASPIIPPLSQQSDAEMVLAASTTSATTPPPGSIPYFPPATRPGKVLDSRIFGGSCFGSNSAVHPPQGQPNDQRVLQSVNQPREHEGLQRQPVTSKFFDCVSSIVTSIPVLALFALPLAAIITSLYGQCISLNNLATGFVISIVMACALFIGNHLVGHCLIAYGRATGTEDAVFDIEKNRRIFMFFLCGLFLAVLFLLAGFILFVQLVFGTGFCHLLGGIFTTGNFILLGAVFAPGFYGIFYLMRTARPR